VAVVEEENPDLVQEETREEVVEEASHRHHPEAETGRDLQVAGEATVVETQSEVTEEPLLTIDIAIEIRCHVNSLNSRIKT
jgi:hypothetical protein